MEASYKVKVKVVARVLAGTTKVFSLFTKDIINTWTKTFRQCENLQHVKVQSNGKFWVVKLLGR